MHKFIISTFVFLTLLAVLGVYIFNTHDFSTSFTSFADFFNGLSITITNVVEFFKDPFVKIGEFFTDLWNGIVDLFDDLLQKIKDLFT